MMSEPLAVSRVDASLSLLTCSAEGSPVRTSALPAPGLASTVSVQDSGESLTDSLAIYDRATSSWKTSQLSLLADSDAFSATFPRAGLMRSGTVYPRVPLAPLTAAIGSGLLPTPVAKDDGKSFEAHMLMKARMPGGARTICTTMVYGANLSDAVKFWPTPTVQDSANNGGSSQYERNSLPLNAAVGGALNPTWVEWLMGYPLGWTVSEAWETRSSRKSRNWIARRILEEETVAATD